MMTGPPTRCGGMERVVPMASAGQGRMTLMMMTWWLLGGD